MKTSSDSALPTVGEKRVAVTAMFDRIAPGYERVNRLISMGQDRRWRRTAIDELALPAGALVLDLACGTGDVCRDLSRSGLRPVGMDLSAGMLEHAHDAGPLVRADALALPVPDGAVAGITCGFALRNFTDLADFFAECARVLGPGGRLALLDAAEPSHALLRAGHAAWFRHAVPWIGGILGDRSAYRYLPASLAYLPSETQLIGLVEAAGFDRVRRTTMTAGAVQLLTATRP